MDHLLLKQLASYHREHPQQAQNPQGSREGKTGWHLQLFRALTIRRKRIELTPSPTEIR